MMQAEVFDLFYLGLDGAGGGKTNTKIYTAARPGRSARRSSSTRTPARTSRNSTWQGPDFGTNFGTRCVGYSRD